MTRRGLLKSFAAMLAGGAVLVRRAQASTVGVGYMDVERCIREGWHPATVYCDGVEIEDCVRFDDRAGWVEYFVHDANDQYIISRPLDGIVTGRRYGCVQFVPNRLSVRRSTSRMVFGP